MAVYLVGLTTSADQDAYQATYLPGAQKIIADCGGRPLVRCVAPPNNITVLEGSVVPNRVSVLEFPSVEAVRAWYDSPEYAVLKIIRQKISTAISIILET